MSKVDAVVTLIERTSLNKVQNYIETMEQNHTKRINILSDGSFTIGIRETDDPSTIFTIDDLRSGLEKHRNLIDPTYSYIRPYIETFESYLEGNSLYNELKKTQAFPNKVFEFRDGKYLNSIIQGLFEMFMKTIEKNEKFKNKIKENQSLIF